MPSVDMECKFTADGLSRGHTIDFHSSFDLGRLAIPCRILCKRTTTRMILTVFRNVNIGASQISDHGWELEREMAGMCVCLGGGMMSLNIEKKFCA